MDENIKKKFGFGCMRLPMNGEEIDIPAFAKMVDTFMEAGFNYFDTAHVYHGGKSEPALKEALTSRYPRESYVLTDKLSNQTFETAEDVRKVVDEELALCGVEYFDYLLMHCQNAQFYPKYQELHCFETAMELKKEGKVRHVGFSFHDTVDVLEQILNDHPETEVVQLQFNYLDYEDPVVQAKACYELCASRNIPVIVMEPVKGGTLANLPDACKAILDELQGGTPASYAIRYAASFDNVMMVLSGMSNQEQMDENVSYMKDFQPLSEVEMDALKKVVDTFHSFATISCTGCHYCTDGCPMGIKIPELFSNMNTRKLFGIGNTGYFYNRVLTVDGNKASDCIQCGQCEGACPQHLPIISLLQDIAAEFEQ